MRLAFAPNPYHIARPCYTAVGLGEGEYWCDTEFALQVFEERKHRAMAEDKTTDLMAFCASEFSGFFTHIGDAIKQFKLTGRLPESAFDGSGPAAGKADAKPKIKRKPTAFNMFVKFKIEELKASGLKLNDDKNNNELFKLAVAEWTQLSDAQRKYYTDKFKVRFYTLMPFCTDLSSLPCCAYANSRLDIACLICRLIWERKVKAVLTSCQVQACLFLHLLNLLTMAEQNQLLQATSAGLIRNQPRLAMR